MPSIALGSLEVTPLELTSVYATLAAGGVYHPPRAVRRVRDSSGDLVGAFTEPEHRRAVSDGVASVVTGILEKNMTSGTGTRAYLADRRPEAGKTGTTSDYADAWFCGYTPDLATCVWVGYPKGRITMENIEGQSVVSGPDAARPDLARLHDGRAHERPAVRLPGAPASRRAACLHPGQLERAGCPSRPVYTRRPARPRHDHTTTGTTTTGAGTTGTPPPRRQHGPGTTTTGN